MYCENITEEFIKYLQSKGIHYVKNFSYKVRTKKINLNIITEQIHIISEFHTRTLGYTGYMNRRLSNNIGRIVEQYKVQIKRLNKDLKKISQNGAENEIEKILLKNGEIYLERSQKCINNILKNNYIDLIMRSTNRVEMCLGNTYFNNLRKTKDIEVKNIEGCCYNMVEMDLIYFLNKLKRKGLEINFSSLIDTFCEQEKLDVNSKEYILSLVSYPYAFMKWCNRYRERHKNKKLDQEDYIFELEKSIIEDGKSLI